MRPFFTWDIQMPATLFMPASSHSCFASLSTTCRPFCAQQMAMPPPMRPEPRIPTFLMGAGCALSPGTLLIIRSAKKRWRNAADCTLKSSFVNSRPSTCKPSLKLPELQAARTQAMIPEGAIMPLALFTAMASAPSRAPPWTLKRFALGTGRLEIGAGGFDNANFAASSTTSPLAMASTMPAFSAFSAFCGAPVRSMGKATSSGATRTMRCVPSPPGRRPSCTSGKPTEALGEMTR
mmetsp:Transcript_3828/g.8748  ORF Transcript_3828/g.8748 Transcript_3828/m.8748 type:complete len:236 (-) Transcript_3828:130-837(-)